MNNKSKYNAKLAIISISMAFGAVALIAAAGAQQVQPTEPLPSVVDQEAIAKRYASELRTGSTLADGGQVAEATALFESVYADSPLPMVRMEAQRKLAALARNRGDRTAFESHLALADEAITERAHDMIPSIAAFARAHLILDRADYAALIQNDSRGALEFYDQALPYCTEVKSLALLAMRNGAAMAVNLGNFDDALRRCDAIIAARQELEIPTDELTALMYTRAGILEQVGRGSEAMDAYWEMWVAGGDTPDELQMLAGLRVAREGQGEEFCARRVTVASRVLARVAQLRLNPHPLDDLDELVRQARVVAADAHDCPDASGIIARSRSQLGL